MSHARRACPKGGRNDATTPTQSLRRLSRLGPSTLPAGTRERITAPTASCNGRHELSLDALTAALASACRPRGERAAWRYAHSCLPRQPAAKLAPRGQARPWGKIATPTQRNDGARHATRTQHQATPTQRDANSLKRTQRHDHADHATQTQRNAGGHNSARGPDADTRGRGTAQ